MTIGRVNGHPGPRSSDPLPPILGIRTIDGAMLAWLGDEQDDDEAEEPCALFLRVSGELYVLWQAWAVNRTELRWARDGTPDWPVPDGSAGASVVAEFRARPAVGLRCEVSVRIGTPGDGEQECLLEARRLDTGEAVIGVGWEWIEYDHRGRWQLPLLASSVAPPAESGREADLFSPSLGQIAVAQRAVPPLVHPGEEVELSTRANSGTYSPTRLIVVEGLDWTIVDIRVAGKSQLAAGVGPLPAAIFAPIASEPIVQFNSLAAGESFSIVARYDGTEPREARLLAMVMVDELEVTRRRERRVVLRVAPPFLDEEVVIETSGRTP